MICQIQSSEFRAFSFSALNNYCWILVNIVIRFLALDIVDTINPLILIYSPVVSSLSSASKLTQMIFVVDISKCASHNVKNIYNITDLTLTDITLSFTYVIRLDDLVCGSNFGLEKLSTYTLLTNESLFCN